IIYIVAFLPEKRKNRRFSANGKPNFRKRKPKTENRTSENGTSENGRLPKTENQLPKSELPKSETEIIPKQKYIDNQSERSERNKPQSGFRHC
ncbi:MAG: hypothetical protein LUG85_01050, partial [Clostridiales bacterium]|nr:hypothetical protein [Clostridiales bacterium]